MKKLLFILLLVSSSAFSQIIVKQIPVSFFFNQTTFEIEAREGKNALILNVGIPNRVNSPNWFNQSEFITSRMSTNSVLAGYRHYKNKFYYQPYIKEQTLSFWNSVALGQFKGYVYTTNAGFQTGYQLSYQRLVFEAYLGPELSRANGKVTGPAIMKDYLTNEVNRVIPSRVGRSVSICNDEVDITVRSFGYIWIRCGFSVGYRF